MFSEIKTRVEQRNAATSCPILFGTASVDILINSQEKLKWYLYLQHCRTKYLVTLIGFLMYLFLS